VCPELHPDGNICNFENPLIYAAYAKDDETRIDSTSGGLFSVLAEEMLSRGGWIAGAVFEENFGLYSLLTNKTEDLVRIRSSKYLQNDPRNLFKDVKSKLDASEQVLVCSTPCQIAALKNFLRKDYPNLITVDFVCKGVSSPGFFHSYLESLEQDYGAKVSSVKFKYKDKEHPWGRLATRIDFENGEIYLKDKNEDSYMQAFLDTGLVVRPSCFECPFKSFPRYSDISLGDFWGIEQILKDIPDKGKGYSAVTINSQRRVEFFKSVEERIWLKPTTKEVLTKRNIHFLQPYDPDYGDSVETRREFLQFLIDNGFKKTVKQFIGYTPKKNKSRIINRIRLAIKYRIEHYSKFSISSLITTHSLNKSKVVKSANGAKIFLLKGSAIDIAPNAQIRLNASLYIGGQRISLPHLAHDSKWAP